MEPFFAQKKKAKETEQIKTRRAAYPYGINDKIGDETSANEDELISTKLPVLKHKYLCTCGINYAKANVTSGTKKYINLKELQNVRYSVFLLSLIRNKLQKFLVQLLIKNMRPGSF